ncbi:fatty acid desaturase [Zavarzinia compransoris]|uniref:fatty acid desaturase n=1 Tax=Zavarzinia marina TaxID=2911065 RepID=UPI001F443A2A|nr:fatty acid desaturase [Zavarzinia marina]MCF4165638.1 fatty acid desaturase [Zavarzinia marina]
MDAAENGDWGLVAALRADERLRELHRLPLLPVPTIALMAGCFLVYGLSCWAFLGGYLPALATIPIGAVAIYVSFTPLHDGTHRAVSRNPVINDILGTLSGQILLPGVSVEVYRHLHLEHHKVTGEHGDDPDDFLTGPKWRSLPLGMFTDIVWFFWYVKRFRQWTPRQNARFTFSFALFFLWHVAWIASPYAMEWVLVWVLPQRLGFGILTYLFAHIQHPPGVEQHDHPLHATVMIERHPLVLFAMLGQSAHLIHHLYPQLPFYRLEAGWDAVGDRLKARDIRFQGLLKPRKPVDLEALHPWMWLRVAAVEDIAVDIRRFRLAPPAGGPLPAYEAGAHVDIRLADGTIRQYSLIGPPGRPDAYEIAVRRDPKGRGGSVAVHRELREGVLIEVGKPRNNFPLRPGAGRIILIGGGIGVTPLLSMAAALKGRDFALHIHARGTGHVPFGAGLERFPFAERIRLHLDNGRGPSAEALARDIGRHKAGDTIYLCGPAPFMTLVGEVAAGLGWPAEAVVTESFAPGDDRPKPAFTVELARSGRRLEVAENQTLTEALAEAGAPVETLCRRGLCGTCRCRVVTGTIDHRDTVLDDAERAGGKTMMACVSRGTPDDVLVLDL